jgi:hypothetical protein
MKLEEAFAKYSDETRLRKKSQPCFDAKIQWWKMHKQWANQESRDMGFIIPQHMIDDANADDFEVVEEVKS